MQFLNCTVLIFLLACSAHAKTYKVAALYWSMNIEGQVAMRNGLEKQVKKYNDIAKKDSTKPKIDLITRVAGDGEAGIEKQITQMNEVISHEKPDIIIVQPTDNAALAAPLLKANKLKIPVIAYDQYIQQGNLLSYVTSNNYQAGRLNGEYIASLYDTDKEIKLILVEYPHVSSTVERVDGFIDALKDAKQKFKIIKNYTAVEPIAGKRAGQSIIRDFPLKGSIDVVFTVNDGGGLSVVQEIAKANRPEIKVATIDGDPKSILNIKNNRNTVIDSAQFCGEMGRKSMELAYNFLTGNKIPQKVLIPTFPITKDTIDIYPGWRGDIPKPFVKPWNNKKWDNNYKYK